MAGRMSVGGKLLVRQVEMYFDITVMSPCIPARPKAVSMQTSTALLVFIPVLSLLLWLRMCCAGCGGVGSRACHGGIVGVSCVCLSPFADLIHSGSMHTRPGVPVYNLCLSFILLGQGMTCSDVPLCR